MTELLKLFFCSAHVPSANMEGAGLMTYTAASQGVIEMLQLHFWGAVMPSIYIYSLWQGVGREAGRLLPFGTDLCIVYSRVPSKTISFLIGK